MPNGDSDEVKGNVKKEIDEGIDILAPNYGIAPNTPLDNIKSSIGEQKKYLIFNIIWNKNCCNRRILAKTIFIELIIQTEQFKSPLNIAIDEVV